MIKALTKRESLLIPLLMAVGVVLFGFHSRSMIVGETQGTVFWTSQASGVALIIIALNWEIRARLAEHANALKRLWRYFKTHGMLVAPFLAVMIGRFIIEPSQSHAVEIFIMLMFASVFLVSIKYGRLMLWPIVIGCAIEAISVLIYAVFIGTWNSKDMTNGGLMSTTNYDIASGFMAIGLACGWIMIKNTRLLLAYSALTITGILMTGSPEGIVSLVMLSCALGIYAVYRGKIRFKYIVTVAVIIGAMLLPWHIWGGMDQTMARTSDILYMAVDDLQGDEIESRGYGPGRIEAYERTLSNISFLGHGYSLTHYRVDAKGHPINDNSVSGQITHNVPLVIVEQIGIVAALWWLFVTVWAFWKSRWNMRLVWVAVLSTCLFDHFIWTTMAPLWWMILGISVYEIYRNRGDYADKQRDMESCAICK